MVASSEPLASEVGVQILRAGGNAVDAAVAVGFALAVTHPVAGNIGGGGFMLVHLAERDETAAIDYRETAPAATTRELLQAQDRFFDLLPFVPQVGKNLADVHGLRRSLNVFIEIHPDFRSNNI